MSFNNRTPFSVVIHKNKIITSAATDYLITRAPWANPVNKYYKLRKAKAISLATGAQELETVYLWDQDLSSSTPTKRGSAGAALYTIPISAQRLSGVAQSSAAQGLNETPPIPFYAGITAQAPINTHIYLELERI